MHDVNPSEERESSLQLLLRIGVVFFLIPVAILFVVRFVFL